MKKYLFVLIIAAAGTTVLAGEGGETNMDDLYFSKSNPALSAQEDAGLAISHKWRGTSHRGIKPVAGQDGMVRFLFGAQQPSIVCAVLQVCDVELQPGERVNDIQLGDSGRWSVEPAVTGGGPSTVNQIQHLMIKPHDVLINMQKFGKGSGNILGGDDESAHLPLSVAFAPNQIYVIGWIYLSRRCQCQVGIP